MENKRKIHIDASKKRELARKMPEEVAEMLLDSPDDMDVDDFISRIGFMEQLLNVLSDRRGKERGGVTVDRAVLTVFAAAVLITAFYLSQILPLITVLEISVAALTAPFLFYYRAHVTAGLRFIGRLPGGMSYKHHA